MSQNVDVRGIVMSVEISQDNADNEDDNNNNHHIVAVGPLGVHSSSFLVSPAMT